MESIIRETVQIPATMADELTNKVDKVLLHPWLGIPIFLLAMLLLVQFIFTLGAPRQDAIAWLLDTLRSEALDPAVAAAPAWLQGLLLDGIYNGIGTVAAFIPIIVLFFLTQRTFIQGIATSGLKG